MNNCTKTAIDMAMITMDCVASLTCPGAKLTYFRLDVLIKDKEGNFSPEKDFIIAYFCIPYDTIKKTFTELNEYLKNMILRSTELTREEFERLHNGKD